MRMCSRGVSGRDEDALIRQATLVLCLLFAAAATSCGTNSTTDREFQTATAKFPHADFMAEYVLDGETADGVSFHATMTWINSSIGMSRMDFVADIAGIRRDISWIRTGGTQEIVCSASTPNTRTTTTGTAGQCHRSNTSSYLSGDAFLGLDGWFANAVPSRRTATREIAGESVRCYQLEAARSELHPWTQCYFAGGPIAFATGLAAVSFTLLLKQKLEEFGFDTIPQLADNATLVAQSIGNAPTDKFRVPYEIEDLTLTPGP